MWLESTEKRGKCVSLKKIMHQPGAGASTVAMSVMWSACKKWKCLRINGRELIDDPKLDEQLKEITEKILFVRSMGEPDDTIRGIERCNPVFILLDNASDELAQNLRKHLQVRVTEKGIFYHHVTLFLVLYLVQKVDTLFRNEDNSLIEPMDILLMKQELSLRDKERFHEKLSELQETNIEPAKMVEFVVMACDFKDSVYVRRVVSDTLKNIHIFSNQESMLLYLSVLKYFANLCLPADVCQSLKDNQTNFEKKLAPKRVLSGLCQPAKVFLSQRNSAIKVKKGNFKFLAIEVSHVPLAEALFIFLKSDKKLSDILLNFIKEPCIMNGEERFVELLNTIARLLVGNKCFFAYIVKR